MFLFLNNWIEKKKALNFFILILSLLRFRETFERLVVEYGRERRDEEQVLLARLQLDQLADLQRTLDQEMGAYIQALFGSKFVQLGLGGAAKTEVRDFLIFIPLF